MSEDTRKVLKKDSEIRIRTDTGNLYTVRIETVIGYGGSCIAYKGYLCDSIGGNRYERSVVIKELYPRSLNIERLPDQSLSIDGSDQKSYDFYKKDFCKGQTEHSKYYEMSTVTSLPRTFIYGEANNTFYAISDPGVGSVLSDIDRSKLNLYRIATIMISLCRALLPIHRNEHIYMDCKPDNIFLYSDNSLQDHVYLFDFDAIINADYVHHKEEYRSISCSPGWRAPELEGYDPAKRTEYKKISYAADIYSAGLVFLWLLTGREPDLDVQRRTEWVNRIFTGEFDWGSESDVCRNASQEAIDAVSSILKQMLIADQKERMDLFASYTEPGRPPRGAYFYKLIHDFQELYGLTFGNDPYYGSVYEAIKRSQEQFLEQTSEAQSALLVKVDHILDGVKEVSEKINHLQADISGKGGSESSISVRKGAAVNRFQYSTESSAFAGRKAELEYLIDMCADSDTLFAWVGICGSGGVGKSRLAYQLCNVMQEKGWKVYAPSHARITVHNIETELKSICKDTLICFDDVKSDIDTIIDFIYYCAETPICSKNKIRIVLLEREFKETFLGCTNALIYRYQRQSTDPDGLEFEFSEGFMRLKRQPAEDIYSIMKSYAFNVYQRSLSADELREIYTAFKNVDPEERPLFSLFVCDAWCNGNDVKKWHRDDALNVAANKEYEKAHDLIKAEYVKKSEQYNALNAVKCIITLSSFAKRIEISQIRDFIFDQYRIDPDDSFQWILKQLGLIEEESLENTYPDVLSEYMSLRFINSLTRKQAVSLFNIIFKNAGQSTFFYGIAICEDYGDLLIAPSNMSIMQFIADNLYIQVGEQITTGFNEQELKEFDRILDEETAVDDDAAAEWLNQHCPAYQDIVFQCFAGVSDYFMSNTDRIFKLTKLDLASGTYSGEVVFDWRCGKGRQDYPDGRVYDGQWNKDECNGTGKMTWKDGTAYNGAWENGKQNGHGIIKCASGTVFDGEWKDGKRFSGKMIFSDGTRYHGEFKNGKFHGQGVMNFVSGSKFTGEFRDGRRYKGKYISVNGWEYDGEWKEGKCCGEGIFISATGEKKEGIWLDDQLVEEWQK